MYYTKKFMCVFKRLRNICYAARHWQWNTCLSTWLWWWNVCTCAVWHSRLPVCVTMTLTCMCLHKQLPVRVTLTLTCMCVHRQLPVCVAVIATCLCGTVADCMCDTDSYLYMWHCHLPVCVCSQINNKDELIHQLREDLECLNRQQKETTAKVNSKKAKRRSKSATELQIPHQTPSCLQRVTAGD